MKNLNDRRWIFGRATAMLRIALLMGAAIFAMTSWVASTVSAEPPPPAFMARLFSPELVIQNQREIKLRPSQRKAITRAIQKTQSETVEIQWAIQDAVHALENEILKDPIDEEAAVLAAEKMMSVEGKLKRAHLGLLIQIRNQLDAEQRKTLKRIREEVGES